MNPQQLKNIIEAALLTAAGPLPMVRLQALFAEETSPPDDDQIKATLETLSQEYAERGIELKQVSSGYRIQARQDMGQWLNRLAEEKPARYSRALLETLALIAYRQPITRAGVEDIRGVSVSSSIIKTLLEREWIRVVGHRDVPGRPALYGTTRQFLDYFNLQSLSELPELAEMRSIDEIQREFELSYSGENAENTVIEENETVAENPADQQTVTDDTIAMAPADAADAPDETESAQAEPLAESRTEMVGDSTAAQAETSDDDDSADDNDAEADTNERRRVLATSV